MCAKKIPGSRRIKETVQSNCTECWALRRPYNQIVRSDCTECWGDRAVSTMPFTKLLISASCFTKANLLKKNTRALKLQDTRTYQDGSVALASAHLLLEWWDPKWNSWFSHLPCSALDSTPAKLDRWFQHLVHLAASWNGHETKCLSIFPTWKDHKGSSTSSYL